MSAEQRSQDDRTMAMLAHGSIILNAITGVGGIIVALVLWLVKRQESPWVGQQALQALVYQVITAVIFYLLLTVSIILIAILVGILCLPLTLLVGLAALAYGVYGAYRCYQGDDFRYWWLGDFLAAQKGLG